jgi:hypothetical protein
MKRTLIIIGVLSLLVFLFIGQVSSTTAEYPTNPACGQYFPVGRVPTAIASGDFLEEGIPDLAVANSSSNTVTVLCFNEENSVVKKAEPKVGTGPRSLAVGDFNGDGKQDLVVANELSGDVTVLLGNGKCEFPTTYTVSTVGNGPISIAVGDFNRDAYQDFIVANKISNDVRIWLGPPPGRLSAPIPIYPSGQGLSSIMVGDFNDDGELDFAVTGETSNNLIVGLGPSYSPDAYLVGLHPISISQSFGWGYLSLIFPRLVEPIIADFNRDHCQDIVVANHGEQDQSSSISVLLGERKYETQQVEGYTFTKFICTGKFLPAINYQVDGNGPSSVVVGEFNGDGLQDIAVVNQKSNSLTILLAQSCDGRQCFPAQCSTASGTPPAVKTCDLTFKIVKKYINICHKPVGGQEVPCDPYAMVVFDKDRDGIDDLAITCKNSANPQENSVIFVTKGLGDGKFCAGNRPPIAIAGPDQTVSVGEKVKLDGSESYDPDGDPITYEWKMVSQPEGSEAALSDPNIVDPTFVADVKGDYVIQLVVKDNKGMSSSPDEVTIKAGNTAAEVGEEPTSVAIADFNNDGLPDLAIANQKSNDVSILLGRGEGALAFVGVYEVGESPSAILARDFNADGFVDIAVTNAGINKISIRLGKGDGTFQEEKRFSVGTAPMGIAGGDFNRDGKIDLAVANSGDGISVLLGEGNGKFKEPAMFNAGDSPEALAIADLDNDQCLDLVVANFTSNDISILLGNCDGTFGVQTRFKTGASPRSIAIGDFNRDEKLDIVVTNFSTNDISVLFGNGDGTFQPQQRFEVGNSPRSVAIGYFDFDEVEDLAVANYGSNDVSILLGDGRGGFRRIRGLAVGEQPTALAVGDFNKDGKDDLVVLNSRANTVWIMLGRGDGTFYDA